jgi:hypothetical protein
MGKQALALLAALDTACASVEDLGQAADKLFRQHPELRDHHQLPRRGRLDRRPGARVTRAVGISPASEPPAGTA